MGRLNGLIAGEATFLSPMADENHIGQSSRRKRRGGHVQLCNRRDSGSVSWMGSWSTGGEPLARATPAVESRLGLDFKQGVARAAVATELGEYFQYQIEHPVTLARQKSALLP